MAIIKHIASKNSNYRTALEYLMFKHDEFSQQPILDDLGNMQLRDEYYLEGLNCEPLTFAAECDRINKSFCKNYSEKEIKSHHYIISFDPEDSISAGLTGEMAQRLGMEFAKKYVAGHQALICTHTDGHNQSGNIHVHIVLNSVRKMDIEETDFTERPCDSRAGYKHHVTDKLLTHMKQYLMGMCEREHLHQVDLLSPSADRVTDNEYWKNRREQRRIDQLENMVHGNDRSGADDHICSTFQAQKQFIRDAVKEVSAYAHSLEEFGSELEKHYGIKIKVSRGRYSYLHPDRSKYMTGSTLGNDYTEEFLLPLFVGNLEAGRSRDDSLKHVTSTREAHKSLMPQRRKNQPDYDPSYDYTADPHAALVFYTKLRLVVDLRTCVKAQQSRAYARKVKLSNLQEMARTICFVQEHGYNDCADIAAEYERIDHAMSKLEDEIQKSDGRIRDLNEQIHYTGQLYVNRNAVVTKRKEAINNGTSIRQLRQSVHKEQQLWDEAQQYFTDRGLSVPNLSDLKAERDRLIKLKSAQQKAYNNFKVISRELDTVNANVDAILKYNRSHNHKRETAQDR